MGPRSVLVPPAGAAQPVALERRASAREISDAPSDESFGPSGRRCYQVDGARLAGERSWVKSAPDRRML